MAHRVLLYFPMESAPALDRLTGGLASRGVDLSAWRPEFLLRRLQRGALLSGDVFVDRHVERILDCPLALQAFLNDLSIGVSRFFRDALAFAALEVVLVHFSRSGDPFTVLSLGCARGQETWSVAMLLAERNAQAGVIGIDRDPIQLEGAWHGRYDFDDVSEVSLARARRWFTSQGGAYVISPELRPRVRFEQADLAKANLAALSPACPVNVVLCRNVLLYLSNEGRRRLLTEIRRVLAPGGVLLLGPADPHQDGPEWDLLSSDVRLYRKRAP